jgi:phosphoheptose isomerase
VSTDPQDAVRLHLQSLSRYADEAADVVSEPAARYAQLVRETLERGGKLLYAGNGGSAAAAG